MKNSPLERKTPLRAGAKSIGRGSTFSSRSSLQGKPGGSTLKAGKRRAKVIDREASAAWAKGARCKPCAVCGAEGAKGHHVITQQQLRLTALELGLEFDRLRWDARNRLPLCDRHHMAHHSRSRPVSMALLVRECPKVAQFARELGLSWWLERTYP